MNLITPIDLLHSSGHMSRPGRIKTITSRGRSSAPVTNGMRHYRRTATAPDIDLYSNNCDSQA